MAYKDINATILLLPYSKTDFILFNPVTEVQTNKNDNNSQTISFSVLITIDIHNRNRIDYELGLYMAFEPTNSHNGKLHLLGKVDSNKKTDTELVCKDNISSPSICKVCKKEIYKLNFKDIPYFGSGRYAVLLLPKDEDLANDTVQKVMNTQLSAAAFKIKVD